MKILVAVDFSESTEIVLQAAEDQATALSAKVLLVHVAEPDPDFVGFKAGPKSMRDSISKEFYKEHVKIHDYAARMGAGGLDVTPMLVQGSTSDAILKEASKLGVDIIVVGSHGRGAMHHLLMGSVSQGVIHAAGCPVLIIPNARPLLIQKLFILLGLYYAHFTY